MILNNNRKRIFKKRSIPKEKIANDDEITPIRIKELISAPTTPPTVPVAYTLPLPLPTSETESTFNLINNGETAPRKKTGNGNKKNAEIKDAKRREKPNESIKQHTNSPNMGNAHINKAAGRSKMDKVITDGRLSANFPPKTYPNPIPVIITDIVAPQIGIPPPKNGAITLVPNISNTIKAKPAVNAVTTTKTPLNVLRSHIIAT